MTINSDVDIPTTIMHLGLKCEGINLSNGAPPHYILRWDTNSDLSPKPTDDELNAGWESYKTAQAAIKYKKDRSGKTEGVTDTIYLPIKEQLDLLYKDIVAGKVTTSGGFATAIKATKDKYPKPS